ncbi:uncharacterized protein LOC133777450 [Humulus lupulus]|uniref:uncharacterized protein LOC133777450 n=1 Tax=Humulus lupulus TaxID=3486 RepID=UPI002B40D988|nr:uncharacterized protein LOC133777450 [Humulus lupulus]
MADFSFLSDTDDSAVEELISQTRDLCVLEQVSAINCSGFVDTLLPSDLESRFNRLKSFPARNSKPNPSSALPHHGGSARYISELTSKTESVNSVPGKVESDEDSTILSPSKQNPQKITPPKSKSPPTYRSSPIEKILGFLTSKESKRGPFSFSSSSSNSSPEKVNFSASKRGLDEKNRLRWRLRSGLFSSPLCSSNSTRKDSPSPPKRAGCLWCSPKKEPRRRSKENWSISSDDWSKNDELLSDLGSFSFKEQRKILKMAMKEQQKISREAQKIVKMARQASARMNVSGIDDELSDN